jgi:hypothetical protein
VSVLSDAFVDSHYATRPLPQLANDVPISDAKLAQTLIYDSGTIAWALHHLALRPDMQDTLREALLRHDTITYDQVETLEYLDAFVKEVLRVCPSIVGTVGRYVLSCPSVRRSPMSLTMLGTRNLLLTRNQLRQATRNDIIPLATPIRLVDGSMASEISIRKGQFVSYPFRRSGLTVDPHPDRSARYLCGRVGADGGYL